MQNTFAGVCETVETGFGMQITGFNFNIVKWENDHFHIKIFITTSFNVQRE